jgi:excisionase family DNA binding protein
MMMTEVDKLLTRKEAAARFQVTTRTLDRWRRRGLLRTVAVGRVVRFRQDDLTAVIHRATT